MKDKRLGRGKSDRVIAEPRAVDFCGDKNRWCLPGTCVFAVQSQFLEVGTSLKNFVVLHSLNILRLVLAHMFYFVIQWNISIRYFEN